MGMRIDEDVYVIERADQLDVRRQQHRVAEDVARHVADADAREVFALTILSKLAEVALHRFPSAARRDAHRFVVIAGAAT